MPGASKGCRSYGSAGKEGSKIRDRLKPVFTRNPKLAEKQAESSLRHKRLLQAGECESKRFRDILTSV